MNYPEYLDYNATTPCEEEVIAAMLPYFSTHFGNASSRNHPYGWMAEQALEEARAALASLIGAQSKEVIFTSGATESLNLAIKGVFEIYSGQKQHYITCQTEHKAVLDCFAQLEKQGAEVTYLPVNSAGEIDLQNLEAQVRDYTKLICLMWANNETGVIHPITEIAQLAEKYRLIFLTDAVQAVGKISVHTQGIHLMAFSAHKMYGPKGVGALYIRYNHPLPKPLAQIHGGGHEKGFRSGTLNVSAIVGFGKAASLRMQNREAEAMRLGILRDSLESQLLSLPGVRINGSSRNRLSHVCNVAIEGVEGEELLQRISLKVAISSGSACSSISPKPSHVLQAMGLPSDLGRASIRFSLGKNTTAKSIELTFPWIKSVIEQLRNT
ncbi:MAG: cysteine desulfurase family protein [Bacteroidetes bacterium]|nr:cysteine desulfurase family protein [Bacteroidota bacterium]